MNRAIYFRATRVEVDAQGRIRCAASGRVVGVLRGNYIYNVDGEPIGSIDELVDAPRTGVSVKC